jgi:hypothetical protein
MLLLFDVVDDAVDEHEGWRAREHLLQRLADRGATGIEHQAFALACSLTARSELP